MMGTVGIVAAAYGMAAITFATRDSARHEYVGRGLPRAGAVRDQVPQNHRPTPPASAVDGEIESALDGRNSGRHLRACPHQPRRDPRAYTPSLPLEVTEPTYLLIFLPATPDNHRSPPVA